MSNRLAFAAAALTALVCPLCLGWTLAPIEIHGSSRHTSERKESPASQGRLCLVLNWLDGNHVLPCAPDGIVHEVKSILEPAGVEIQWKHDGRFRRIERSEGVVFNVVLIPSDPSGPGWGLGPRTLGAILIPDRATGRVIVHEIVHAVVPSRPHSAEGLMRARLGRRSLFRREAALDAFSTAAFVSGLRRLEASENRPSSSLESR